MFGAAIMQNSYTASSDGAVAAQLECRLLFIGGSLKMALIMDANGVQHKLFLISENGVVVADSSIEVHAKADALKLLAELVFGTKYSTGRTRSSFSL